jgi:hypothetical protein
MASTEVRHIGDLSSDDGVMEKAKRTYRFVVTVQVEPGHPAYDDPEWAADAAHGTLVNDYGLRAVYHDVVDVTDQMKRIW